MLIPVTEDCKGYCRSAERGEDGQVESEVIRSDLGRAEVTGRNDIVQEGSIEQGRAEGQFATLEKIA